MARISTYSLDTSVKGTDKLIGTDVENNNVTKNFSVGDLATFIADNQPSDLDLVGINLRWSKEKQYVSSRTDWTKPNLQVTVPLLHMEFENLTLEPGVTYEVVIERFTKKRKRGATATGYKPSGFKIEEITHTNSPYDVRPVSLPITDPTGALYDFKLDYYFSKGYPALSGASALSRDIYHSRLPIGFRIKKTTNGVVEYSHTLRKINLVAGLSDPVSQSGIGFTEL
jgi:hypothetical protein